MRRMALVGALFLLVTASSAARAPQPSVDEREALLRADRDFDQVTAEKGMEGWLAYFAENGSMLPQSGPPTTGHEAIRKAMEPAFANPDFSLRWQPTRAEILIPSELGYTVGRFVRKTKDAEGKTVVVRGTYVSLWKRQADGSWKIVLDTGSPDGPPTVQD